MRYLQKWMTLLLLTVVLASLVSAAAGDGSWLMKVPEKDRARANPFADNPRAVMAGAKLFEQNCASCHGREAEGKEKKPGLRSERIRKSSPGELQWLLTNGSLRNGMPSWARLPEPQRWQLVVYLKSLQ